MKRQSKFERLSPESHYNRPDIRGETPGAHPKGSSLGQASALFTNVRLGLKGLNGTDTRNSV